MADSSKPRPPVRAPRSPPRPTDDADQTVAGALRAQLTGQSWNAVRRLCETGKVRVDGALALDPAARIARTAELTVDMTAPRPRVVVPGFRVAFEDRHLIVIAKPAGIPSVPYERREGGTALDLIRTHWRGQFPGRGATDSPLYTVHRLDKETSGLLCFAKTRAGERGLHLIFQRHLATRAYLAVVHGSADGGRIESRLVPDRGDGLRGSTRTPGQGQHAVTHVEIVERLRAATVCRVRLETGRTHQIRIHLAEAGHPVVGDAVYIRDLRADGGRVLPSSRLLLHAATLGFDHPVTGARIDLACAPPADFDEALAALRREKAA